MSFQFPYGKILYLFQLSLANPGGAAGVRPQGSRFLTIFFETEVNQEIAHTLMRLAPLTGNPGSATGCIVILRTKKLN